MREGRTFRFVRHFLDVLEKNAMKWDEPSLFSNTNCIWGGYFFILLPSNNVQASQTGWLVIAPPQNEAFKGDQLRKNQFLFQARHSMTFLSPVKSSHKKSSTQRHPMMRGKHGRNYSLKFDWALFCSFWQIDKLRTTVFLHLRWQL